MEASKQEKTIKDYLHLYLGCEMQYSTHHEPQDEKYILSSENLKEAIEFEDLPILRPLSSMSLEEANLFLFNHKFHYEWINAKCVEHFCIDYAFTYSTSNRVRYDSLRFDELKPQDVIWLLSKGFDLFGLIEAGLAIQKPLPL